MILLDSCGVNQESDRRVRWREGWVSLESRPDGRKVEVEVGVGSTPDGVLATPTRVQPRNPSSYVAYWTTGVAFPFLGITTPTFPRRRRRPTTMTTTISNEDQHEQWYNSLSSTYVYLYRTKFLCERRAMGKLLLLGIFRIVESEWLEDDFIVRHE